MGCEWCDRQSVISGHFKAAFRVDPKASPSQYPHTYAICSLMGNRRYALFMKKKVSCFRIINGVLIGRREACPKCDIYSSTDTAIIINAIAMQRFVMPKPMLRRSFHTPSPKNERVHACCAVVIIFEIQTFSLRGFRRQCGKNQYRAYIPPGVSKTCTQIRQSSSGPDFISSLAVSFFELPILSRRQTIPFFFIVQAPTNPPPPLSIVTIVTNQPLPTFSIRGCRTAIATAERTHLTVLPAAAAMLGLSGNTSTSSALNVC